MNPSAASSGALTVEDDLEQAWNKTIASLETEAHFKLDMKPVPSVDDITRIINPPKADPNTTSKIKNVFNRALVCIDRIGGMIAQVGSVAFGPSQQVLNAVSFLIKVSQGTQEVFDNLALLMERLTVFLERLDGYFSREGIVKLDRDLRPSVYRVLVQFVTIMAKSYRLTRSWKGEDGDWKDKAKKFGAKITVFVKLGAFGDDSGVKAAIATFENLIAQISQVQIDVIHRTLSTAALAICDIREEVTAMHSTVREIAEAQEQMRGDAEDKKTDYAIWKALGLEGKDADSPSRAHGELVNLIEGAGKWLIETYDFRQWLNVRCTRDRRHNVLAIQGPEGYGKSFLVHAVINRLGSQMLDATNPLSMRIAWYYLPKSLKSISLNLALRCIIWQLVKSDRAYKNFVKTASDGLSDSDRENAQKLWNQLLEDYAKKRPGFVFYIILDGVDHIESDDLAQLRRIVEKVASSKTEPEGLRIRLLISGTRGSIEDLQRLANPISTIDLLPFGGIPSQDLLQNPDIRAFVGSRLDQFKMFQDELSAEQKELKEKILDRVIDAARGDYNILKRQLRDIAECDDAVQIDETLKRLNEDSTKSIKRKIEELNDLPNAQHIRQLNVAFTWVSEARTGVNDALLRAVLSVAFEEATLFSPLNFMDKNCKKLLEISSEGFVNFLPDVKECLEAANATRTPVPEPQIDLIEAMLQTQFERTFGQSDLYWKFEFQKFFDEKRNVQSDLIHLAGKSQNALTILEACLKALCDLHGSKKHEPLRDYASDSFDKHLVDTVIDDIEYETRQQIGRRLFRIIREDAVIDTWVKADLNQYFGMTDWFDKDNKFIEILAAWMKHPQVYRSIQTVTTETDWLSDVNLGKAPQTSLLQHIARRLLQRWYHVQKYDEYMNRTNTELLIWVRGYFQRASSFAAIYRNRHYSAECTADELQQWEQWVREELQIEQHSAKWLFRMATVYHIMGQRARSSDRKILSLEARAKCAEAISLDEHMWQAQIFQAEVLSGLEDHNACLEQLTRTTRQFEALVGSHDEYDQVYWNTVIPKIADCYVQRKDFVQATVIYRQLIDHVLEHGVFSSDVAGQICGAINALLKQHMFQDSFALIETLDGRMDDDKSWLCAMLETTYSDMHQHFVTLARQSHAFPILENYYGKYIEDATVYKGEIMRYNRWRLRLYCGPLAAQDCISSEWEDILECMKDALRFNSRAATEVAKTLHSVVMVHGIDSQIGKESIERMRELNTATSDFTRDFPEIDVKLSIARLYSRAGDETRAREELLPLMRQAIKQARDEDHPQEGYSLLAHILKVLDGDEDTQVAWCLSDPKRDTPENAEENNGGKQEFEATGAQPPHESEDSPTPALDRVLSNDDGASTTTMPVLDDSNATNKKPLKGRISLHCDGNCDTHWTYADDMWICKDCLDLQLDPGCYQRLRDGALDITICSKDHQHVHIPAFDEKAWRAQDATSIVVGAHVVDRERWLSRLETEWDLGRFAKAAKGIYLAQKQWLARKERLAQKHKP